VKRLALVLMLASCGPATPSPTPDAGSVADAGAPRDAGLPLDAGSGSADAGPTEPTLASAVLFRDDFEGYGDLQALRSSYPELREQGGAIALERDGGRALRLDYAAPTGCGAVDVHVGKLVAGDVPTVLVTWRFKTSPGFSSCSDAGIEDFVLTRTGARTTFENLGDAWALRTGATEFRQQLRLDTHAPRALAAATWHRATLVITRQSSAGAADGTAQGWIDGALIIDARGQTGTAPFTLATWPGAARLDAAGARWVDDLAIATP